MRAVRCLFARFRNFATTRGGNERLREEMEQHLALQTEEKIRSGMTLLEARRQARLKWGGAESIRESVHAERGLPSYSLRYDAIRRKQNLP